MKKEASTTENSKDHTKKKWSKKKGALGAVAAAGVLAMSAFVIAPTTAAWTDTEAVTSSMASGTFDLEISTNGGTTWQSTGGTSVAYTMPAMATWAPGDQSNSGDNIRLRVSSASTNDAVIQFNTCGTSASSGVQVTGGGSAAAHYSWTIGSTNEAGSAFTISNTGLNSCSPSPLTATTGKVVIPRGNTTGVSVPITMRALDTLTQGGTASTLTVRFNAESVPR